ncbi:MAG: TRAP transporter large permease subunit [Paludibacter sp.]
MRKTELSGDGVLDTDAPSIRNEPAVFDRLQRFLELASQRLALIAVAAVLLIACANVTDVVLRNFFSLSLYGLNEINALLVAIAVSTCLPYGMARDAPLRIAILKGRVTPAAEMWCGALAATCMLLFLALLAWRMGAAARNIGLTNQTTVMTEIPKAPFFWAVAVAISLAAVVQAVAAIRLMSQALTSSPRYGLWILAAGVIVLGYATLALLSLVPAGWLAAIRPDTPLLLTGLAFLLMWVAILATVPLGAAMGLTGIIGTAVLISAPVSLEVLGSETASYITRDALSVLPLFLLMGALAAVAGIGTDLYRLAYALFGHIRGGLAHASILACAGFGTMTGSAVATQMTIGKIALKEMQQRGYSNELGAGSIAAGGTLGQLIPPASALILYAVMTEQSVGRLFMGAIIPGVLATLLYMATVTVWTLLYPHHAPRRAERSSLAEVVDATRKSWSVLLLLGVVLSGIYFGFFTELEAGSVGAVGAFLIALLRGKLNPKTFWATMGETTITLAMMYTLIFGVVMLSFFFGVAQLPQAFVGFVQGLGLEPLMVVICLVLCYLILGTVMDEFAMMVITIPIFAPLVASLGFDPIWWGVLTILCMEAGAISPPFGLNIFVISALDPRIPLSSVYRGCWPFFASALFKIAVIIAFPVLVTWLPSHM